jgi:hypothetical protein
MVIAYDGFSSRPDATVDRASTEGNTQAILRRYSNFVGLFQGGVGWVYLIIALCERNGVDPPLKSTLTSPPISHLDLHLPNSLRCDRLRVRAPNNCTCWWDPRTE